MMAATNRPEHTATTTTTTGTTTEPTFPWRRPLVGATLGSGTRSAGSGVGVGTGVSLPLLSTGAADALAIELAVCAGVVLALAPRVIDGVRVCDGLPDCVPDADGCGDAVTGAVCVGVSLGVPDVLGLSLTHVHTAELSAHVPVHRHSGAQRGSERWAHIWCT